jgi:hypothetical protein
VRTAEDAHRISYSLRLQKRSSSLTTTTTTADTGRIQLVCLRLLRHHALVENYRTNGGAVRPCSTYLLEQKNLSRRHRTQIVVYSLATDSTLAVLLLCTGYKGPDGEGIPYCY